MNKRQFVFKEASKGATSSKILKASSTLNCTMAALKFILVFLLLIGLSRAPSPFVKYISTVVQEPFVIPDLNDTEAPYYKGILIEMMSKFQESWPGYSRFTRLLFTEHAEFGRKLPNGTWTGLIGDIVDFRSGAYIGLGAITVNAPRIDAVKFSIPYFTTGLSAVGKAINFSIVEENLPKLLKMAEEDKITVGMMKYGTSEIFMRDTNITIYKKLYEQMNKNPQNFVKTYTEGIEKVRASSIEKPYIFFGEKAFLDYYTGKEPCDLKVLTCETLNTVHYALVFKESATGPTIAYYNTQIANYLASGLMQISKLKWYANECQGKETELKLYL